MRPFSPPAPGSLAVVTGASAGIGRGFALALARRGHPVLAVARREDRLRTLADEARAAGAATIHALGLDVTAAGATDAIRDAVLALGPLGWVVNNAGGGRFGRLERSSPADEMKIVRLNCEAVVGVSTALLPVLVGAGRGIVLNISSVAGFQPTPGMAVYGASKAFVLSFSEALYEELRGSGVSVTALCPGPVTTDIFEASGASANRRKPSHEISVETCVDFGLRGALRGKPVVIPGAMNQMTAMSSRLAPRGVVRRISARSSLKYIGLDPLPPRSPGRGLLA